MPGLVWIDVFFYLLFFNCRGLSEANEVRSFNESENEMMIEDEIFNQWKLRFDGFAVFSIVQILFMDDFAAHKVL